MMSNEKQKLRVELFEKYLYLVHHSVNKRMKRTPSLQTCDKDDLLGYGILGLWEGLSRSRLDDPKIEHFLAKTIKYKIIRGLSSMKGLKRNRKTKQIKQLEFFYPDFTLKKLSDDQQHVHLNDATVNCPQFTENKMLLKLDLDLFKATLSECSRKIFQAYLDCKTCKEIAELLNYRPSYVYWTLCKLKISYKKWLQSAPIRPKYQTR